MSQTLGDIFPVEVERVRDLVQAYREIGPAGRFALSQIEPLLRKAEQANREQDAVAMIRLLKQLQECE